jgi:glutamyl/glutaminyl-tRNA synthetase
MARRFELTRVTHSAAVFDTGKLEWMNREYMKATPTERLTRLAWPYFERADVVRGTSESARAYVSQWLLPMAVGAVDRLEELPDRVAFIFDWSADETARRVMAEPEGARVVAAFAEVLSAGEPLIDKERFRQAAAAVRERVGAKGKALFHPLRVAMTGLDSGPELDLAIPAIEHGAAVRPADGLNPVLSCRERATRLVERLS